MFFLLRNVKPIKLKKEIYRKLLKKSQSTDYWNEKIYSYNSIVIIPRNIVSRQTIETTHQMSGSKNCLEVVFWNQC